MPIASDVWVEVIRPKEAPSIVASFVLKDQAQGDPAGIGKPFIMEIDGLGEVVFSFVACVKGQAIYSASLPDQAIGQDQSPVRARLVCQEFLREAP